MSKVYIVDAHLRVKADTKDEAENIVLNALSKMIPNLEDVPDVDADEEDPEPNYYEDEDDGDLDD